MITALSAILMSVSLTGGSLEMLADSFDIPVGDYRYVLFGLNETQQESARVEGILQVLPDTLELEVLLFHIDDFNRWTRGSGDVDTLFLTRSRSGPLTVPVPGFGDLVLVLSNRGNWQAASVRAEFRLVFAGSGLRYNPLVDASRIVLGMFAGAVFIVVAIGAWITVRKRERRRLLRAARKVDRNIPPA